jgi:hypothetical protein
MLAVVNDHVLTHEHPDGLSGTMYPRSHENERAFLEQEPSGFWHFDMLQYPLAKELVTTRSLNVKKINKKHGDIKISVSPEN